ncbi:indolepyruvate ferredoxin oxidoreductase family protein [Pedomonas sp. V897]|uniref:indolepyruvate ferredoxin oxidoreductase family protein n=1 Tax=Pedomonas sp. V897 TaxID=3446482 RepID=UPI003EE08BB3
MALLDPRITLEDKYTKERGRVFISGLQALVRLPLVQAARDRAAGLNTGGFISGYRGSPLGNYDQELWRAKKLLDERNIVFQSGINEDLAATAVWGSQQVGLRPGAKVDGVFGIWYGKGPGLDRSMDVLKHANAAGTSPHGGVLCVVGDDHGAKSSTLPHQSDHNFQAAFMPFLYPASVHEYVEYGLLGLAMSRFSGCWVGFKATADTVETAATVELDNEWREIVIPQDFEMPEGGLHIRLGDIWREEDSRLQLYKGFAAQAFARANRIDRVIWDSPRPRLGIVSAGKAYADTLQALEELGIDEAVAAEIGIRLYKVGMPWPLEPHGIRQFCEGLEEVLVIEEKREFLEHQIKWQLYNWDEKVRPRVVGKYDENGQWLLHPDNELTLGEIAHVIASRIARFHTTDRIRAKLEMFAARAAAKRSYAAPIARKPYFCSGCPHNTSTKVPENSRALAGIGCHIMALWMDRNTETFTQMGGEGVTWVGEAPFTTEKHVFCNLGDGTYFHSGILAIRQSVAAGVNITYKLLYNDAVAMTGGQHVDGELTIPELVQQLLGENVRKIVVLTEDMSRYETIKLPGGVPVLPRAELDRIQKEFRETPGCTVIVYDQTCAAEKRRRRKKGQFPDPDKRVMINAAVCEGCGDCSVQSNCVSVEPLETEFGRKRTINQSSCNKDFSCLKGFCPSFVTVEGGKIATPALPKQTDFAADVPMPSVGLLTEDYNVIVTGIGGTGVLTISAILGMAAHIEGKASTTADMAGLAQKGGAVYAQVRLGASNDHLLSPRIITGGADLLLACDAVVAASAVIQDLMTPERTTAVVNSAIQPIADFVRNRDFDFRHAQVERAIRNVTKPDASDFIPAEKIATAIMGDAIATNMMMLGYAWQKGRVPLMLDSIAGAIKLNGVAVDFNLRAFALGRLLAHDPAKVQALVEAARGPIAEPLARTLDEVVAKRVADLTAYQDAAYAERYRNLVRKVQAAESRVAPGSDKLALAVARNAYKLMAYKDEYEVARLYTDGRFEQALKAQFGSHKALKVHLSPPLLARHDPATGRPKKMVFGGWMFGAFKLLARLKGLRGTALDIFGYTEERRMERQLVEDYFATVEKLLAGLAPERLELAVAIAAVPDQIRGFGPVKAASVPLARKREAELWTAWDGKTSDRKAA